MKSEQFVKHTYVTPEMEAIAMSPHCALLNESQTYGTQGENMNLYGSGDYEEL